MVIGGSNNNKEEDYEYDGIGKVPKNVTHIRIGGGGVRKIHHDAFSYCQSLVHIQIPFNSVQIIGSFSFYHCSSLQSIDLPSSLTMIQPSSFMNCTSLSSITLPSSSLYNIGCNAFAGCTSLSSIDLSSSSLLTAIERRTFEGCTSLTSIILPSTIQQIKKRAFAECSSLTCIQLPSSLHTIGDNVFCDCTSLTTITLSSSLQHIGYDAFSNCPSLTCIQLLSPNDTTTTTIHSIVETVKVLVLSFIHHSNHITCTIPSSSSSSITLKVDPLHLLLLYGHVYCYRDGIRKLIDRTPSSLTQMDPIHHMYPFLLAACSPYAPPPPNTTTSTSILDDKLDLHHLETIYVLLREAPWLLNLLLYKSETKQPGYNLNK